MASKPKQAPTNKDRAVLVAMIMGGCGLLGSIGASVAGAILQDGPAPVTTEISTPEQRNEQCRVQLAWLSDIAIAGDPVADAIASGDLDLPDIVDCDSAAEAVTDIRSHMPPPTAPATTTP